MHINILEQDIEFLLGKMKFYALDNDLPEDIQTPTLYSIQLMEGILKSMYQHTDTPFYIEEDLFHNWRLGLTNMATITQDADADKVFAYLKLMDTERKLVPGE